MNGIERLIDALGDGIDRFPESDLRVVLAMALALVLLYSGSMKLRAPWATAMALVDFGVAARPDRRRGLALAATELLVAGAAIAGLFLAPALLHGAVGVAAVLFAAFCWAIARALRRGHRFPCQCFGETESVISGRSLARTALLLACALAVFAAGPAGLERATGEAVLAVVVAIGACGAVSLLVVARPIARLPEPPELS
jgi:hypothetical protein